jgi:bifunctional non-homologous end joining protein LigD
MNELNKVSLYCKEGGADKAYTMWLREEKGGWTVQFQYGPRGGWVKDGTKTPKPVSQDAAKKVYDKLMAEKKAKGYTAGEDAPAFSQTEGAVDSGLRPMLLTNCTDDGPDRFIEDDAWCAQEKLNGKRIMIRRTKDGKVIGSNKRGLVCPIPVALTEEVESFGHAVTLDGELIGDVYHAFDLLEMVGDWRETRFGKRHDGLLEYFSDKKHIRVVPRVFGREEKAKFVKDLKKRRKEGVAFKQLGAHYVPGRIEDQKKAIAVKVKFYAAVSAVVLGWKKDKQSIEVGLREEIKDSKAKIISVGWVTVPTKYVEQVVVGKPVRVKYLYTTPGHQLYQAHLDPTDDGLVMADQLLADPFGDLKYEGKDEE